MIPVINEAENLAEVVENARQAGADEIIVADGGSTDGSRKIAKAMNCELVESAPGRGIQQNSGASIASGDVLLFLHADNRLTPKSCREIRRQFETNQNETWYGCFRQQIDHSATIYRWIELGNEWRVKWQGLVYGDQAMFVTRKLFDQVGGFPEIRIMEDFEISRRLSRRHRPIILTGPVVVSSRRWNQNGPVRQTFRNWWLSTAFRLGASPEWIETQYRRHDRY
ncbi:MAG: TIGR04283 family arsenosugar biosynthesis glycosyltransferase [Planctomycetota bacterium]